MTINLNTQFQTGSCMRGVQYAIEDIIGPIEKTRKLLIDWKNIVSMLNH